MKDNSKNIVLVTGAAARIGQRIALSLSELGWIVAVHYGTSAAAARDTEEEARPPDAGRRIENDGER
ncbi:MAG: hypothetical protein CMM36_02240 [Rhodospirillaceae bacterium]|nr:hypothetical protein [Rhodospirillaceae bacterium]